jgi:hypothetical protein
MARRRFGFTVEAAIAREFSHAFVHSIAQEKRRHVSAVHNLPGCGWYLAATCPGFHLVAR